MTRAHAFTCPTLNRKRNKRAERKNVNEFVLPTYTAPADGNNKKITLNRDLRRFH